MVWKLKMTVGSPVAMISPWSHSKLVKREISRAGAAARKARMISAMPFAYFPVVREHFALLQ